MHRYRSRFWTLFDGNGFLHLAVHEDEIRKLWGELDLFPERLSAGPTEAAVGGAGSKGSTGDAEADGDAEVDALEGGVDGSSQHMAFPDLLQRANEALAAAGPGAHGLRLSAEALRLSAGAVGAAAPATAAAAAASGGPLGSSHGDEARPPGGQRAMVQVAAVRLKEERRLLYQRLKQRQFNSQRDSFFKLFGITGRKRRKQTLAAQVWEAVEQADKSAEVRMRAVAKRDLPATSVRSLLPTAPLPLPLLRLRLRPLDCAGDLRHGHAEPSRRGLCSEQDAAAHPVRA